MFLDKPGGIDSAAEIVRLTSLPGLDRRINGFRLLFTGVVGSWLIRDLVLVVAEISQNHSSLIWISLYCQRKWS